MLLERGQPSIKRAMLAQLTQLANTATGIAAKFSRSTHLHL